MLPHFSFFLQFFLTDLLPYLSFPLRIDPLHCILHPSFDFWSWCYIYIYIVCLFTLYASPLILFLHFFLTYLLPYLSFPFTIGPLHFQARCRKRRLNLVLVFLCCSRFYLIGECITKPRHWLGKRLRNDLFCVEWDIKTQLHQSHFLLLLLYQCRGDGGEVGGWTV